MHILENKQFKFLVKVVAWVTIITFTWEQVVFADGGNLFSRQQANKEKLRITEPREGKAAGQIAFELTGGKSMPAPTVATEQIVAVVKAPAVGQKVPVTAAAVGKSKSAVKAQPTTTVTKIMPQVKAPAVGQNVPAALPKPIFKVVSATTVTPKVTAAAVGKPKSAVKAQPTTTVTKIMPQVTAPTVGEKVPVTAASAGKPKSTETILAEKSLNPSLKSRIVRIGLGISLVSAGIIGALLIGSLSLLLIPLAFIAYFGGSLILSGMRKYEIIGQAGNLYFVRDRLTGTRDVIGTLHNESAPGFLGLVRTASYDEAEIAFERNYGINLSNVLKKYGLNVDTIKNDKQAWARIYQRVLKDHFNAMEKAHGRLEDSGKGFIGRLVMSQVKAVKETWAMAKNSRALPIAILAFAFWYFPILAGPRMAMHLFNSFALSSFALRIKFYMFGGHRYDYFEKSNDATDAIAKSIKQELEFAREASKPVPFMQRSATARVLTALADWFSFSGIIPLAKRRGSMYAASIIGHYAIPFLLANPVILLAAGVVALGVFLYISRGMNLKQRLVIIGVGIVIAGLFISLGPQILHLSKPVISGLDLVITGPGALSALNTAFFLQVFKFRERVKDTAIIKEFYGLNGLSGLDFASIMQYLRYLKEQGVVADRQKAANILRRIIRDTRDTGIRLVKAEPAEIELIEQAINSLPGVNGVEPLPNLKGDEIASIRNRFNLISRQSWVNTISSGEFWASTFASAFMMLTVPAEIKIILGGMHGIDEQVGNLLNVDNFEVFTQFAQLIEGRHARDEYGRPITPRSITEAGVMGAYDYAAGKLGDFATHQIEPAVTGYVRELNSSSRAEAQPLKTPPAPGLQPAVTDKAPGVRSTIIIDYSTGEVRLPERTTFFETRNRPEPKSMFELLKADANSLYDIAKSPLDKTDVNDVEHWKCLPFAPHGASKESFVLWQPWSLEKIQTEQLLEAIRLTGRGNNAQKIIYYDVAGVILGQGEGIKDYLDFIKSAKTKNIEVIPLLGDPEWATKDNWQTGIKFIRQLPWMGVFDYSNGPPKIALDIEPQGYFDDYWETSRAGEVRVSDKGIEYWKEVLKLIDEAQKSFSIRLDNPAGETPEKGIEITAFVPPSFKEAAARIRDQGAAMPKGVNFAIMAYDNDSAGVLNQITYGETPPFFRFSVAGELGLAPDKSSTFYGIEARVPEIGSEISKGIASNRALSSVFSGEYILHSPTPQHLLAFLEYGQLPDSYRQSEQINMYLSRSERRAGESFGYISGIEKIIPDGYRSVTNLSPEAIKQIIIANRFIQGPVAGVFGLGSARAGRDSLLKTIEASVYHRQPIIIVDDNMWVIGPKAGVAFQVGKWLNSIPSEDKAEIVSITRRVDGSHMPAEVVLNKDNPDSVTDNYSTRITDTNKDIIYKVRVRALDNHDGKSGIFKGVIKFYVYEEGNIVPISFESTGITINEGREQEYSLRLPAKEYSIQTYISERFDLIATGGQSERQIDVAGTHGYNFNNLAEWAKTRENTDKLIAALQSKSKAPNGSYSTLTPYSLTNDIGILFNPARNALTDDFINSAMKPHGINSIVLDDPRILKIIGMYESQKSASRGQGIFGSFDLPQFLERMKHNPDIYGVAQFIKQAHKNGIKVFFRFDEDDLNKMGQKYATGKEPYVKTFFRDCQTLAEQFDINWQDVNGVMFVASKEFVEKNKTSISSVLDMFSYNAQKPFVLVSPNAGQFKNVTPGINVDPQRTLSGVSSVYDGKFLIVDTPGKFFAPQINKETWRAFLGKVTTSDWLRENTDSQRKYLPASRKEVIDFIGIKEIKPIYVGLNAPMANLQANGASDSWESTLAIVRIRNLDDGEFKVVSIPLFPKNNMETSQFLIKGLKPGQKYLVSVEYKPLDANKTLPGEEDAAAFVVMGEKTIPLDQDRYTPILLKNNKWIAIGTNGRDRLVVSGSLDKDGIFKPAEILRNLGPLSAKEPKSIKIEGEEITVWETDAQKEKSRFIGQYYVSPDDNGILFVPVERLGARHPNPSIMDKVKQIKDNLNRPAVIALRSFEVVAFLWALGMIKRILKYARNQVLTTVIKIRFGPRFNLPEGIVHIIILPAVYLLALGGIGYYLLALGIAPFIVSLIGVIFVLAVVIWIWRTIQRIGRSYQLNSDDSEGANSHSALFNIAAQGRQVVIKWFVSTFGFIPSIFQREQEKVIGPLIRHNRQHIIVAGDSVDNLSRNIEKTPVSRPRLILHYMKDFWWMPWIPLIAYGFYHFGIYIAGMAVISAPLIAAIVALAITILIGGWVYGRFIKPNLMDHSPLARIITSIALLGTAGLITWFVILPIIPAFIIPALAVIFIAVVTFFALRAVFRFIQFKSVSMRSAEDSKRDIPVSRHERMVKEWAEHQDEWLNEAVTQAESMAGWNTLDKEEQLRLVRILFIQIMKKHADILISEDDATTFFQLWKGIFGSDSIADAVRLLRENPRLQSVMPNIYITFTAEPKIVKTVLERFKPRVLYYTIGMLAYAWSFVKSIVFYVFVQYQFVASMIFRGMRSLDPGANAIHTFGLAGIEVHEHQYRRQVFEIYGRWLIGHMFVRMKYLLGRRFTRSDDLTRAYEYDLKAGSIRDHILNLLEQARAVETEGDANTAAQLKIAAYYAALQGHGNSYFGVGEIEEPTDFIIEDFPDGKSRREDLEKFGGPEWLYGLPGVIGQRVGTNNPRTGVPFTGVSFYFPRDVEYQDGAFAVINSPVKVFVGFNGRSRPKSETVGAAMSYLHGYVNAVISIEEGRIAGNFISIEQEMFPEIERAERAVAGAIGRNTAGKKAGDLLVERIRRKLSTNMRGRYDKTYTIGLAGKKQVDVNLIPVELGLDVYKGWKKIFYKNLQFGRNLWNVVSKWYVAGPIFILLLVNLLLLHLSIPFLLPFLIMLYAYAYIFAVPLPLSFYGNTQSPLLQGLKAHYIAEDVVGEVEWIMRNKSHPRAQAAINTVWKYVKNSDVLKKLGISSSYNEDQRLAALLAYHLEGMYMAIGEARAEYLNYGSGEVGIFRGGDVNDRFGFERNPHVIGLYEEYGVDLIRSKSWARWSEGVYEGGKRVGPSEDFENPIQAFIDKANSTGESINDFFVENCHMQISLDALTDVMAEESKHVLARLSCYDKLDQQLKNTGYLRLTDWGLPVWTLEDFYSRISQKIFRVALRIVTLPVYIPLFMLKRIFVGVWHFFGLKIPYSKSAKLLAKEFTEILGRKVTPEQLGGLWDAGEYDMLIGTYLAPGHSWGRIPLWRRAGTIINAPPVPAINAILLFLQPPYLAPLSGFNYLPTNMSQSGMSFAEDTDFSDQNGLQPLNMPRINADAMLSLLHLSAQREQLKHDEAVIRAMQLFKGWAMAEALKELGTIKSLINGEQLVDPELVQILTDMPGMSAFDVDEVKTGGGFGVGSLLYGFTGQTGNTLFARRVGPFAPGEVIAYWAYRYYQQLDREMGGQFFSQLENIQKQRAPKEVTGLKGLLTDPYYVLAVSRANPVLEEPPLDSTSGGWNLSLVPQPGQNLPSTADALGQAMIATGQTATAGATGLLEDHPIYKDLLRVSPSELPEESLKALIIDEAEEAGMSPAAYLEDTIVTRVGKITPEYVDKIREENPPDIVAIVGGNASRLVCGAAHNNKQTIYAIVPMTDDSGGGGILREKLGDAPGDLASALTSMADPAIRSITLQRISSSEAGPGVNATDLIIKKLGKVLVEQTSVYNILMAQKDGLKPIAFMRDLIALSYKMEDSDGKVFGVDGLGLGEQTLQNLIVQGCLYITGASPCQNDIIDSQKQKVGIYLAEQLMQIPPSVGHVMPVMLGPCGINTNRLYAIYEGLLPEGWGEHIKDRRFVREIMWRGEKRSLVIGEGNYGETLAFHDNRIIHWGMLQGDQFERIMGSDDVTAEKILLEGAGIDNINAPLTNPEVVWALGNIKKGGGIVIGPSSIGTSIWPVLSTPEVLRGIVDVKKRGLPVIQIWGDAHTNEDVNSSFRQISDIMIDSIRIRIGHDAIKEIFDKENISLEDLMTDIVYADDRHVSEEVRDALSGIKQTSDNRKIMAPEYAGYRGMLVLTDEDLRWLRDAFGEQHLYSILPFMITYIKSSGGVTRDGKNPSYMTSVTARIINRICARNAETLVTGAKAIGTAGLNDDEFNKAVELVAADAVGENFAQIKQAEQIAKVFAAGKLQELKDRLAPEGKYALILHPEPFGEEANAIGEKLVELGFEKENIFRASAVGEVEEYEQVLDDSLVIVVNKLGPDAVGQLEAIMPGCQFAGDIVYAGAAGLAKQLNSFV